MAHQFPTLVDARFELIQAEASGSYRRFHDFIQDREYWGRLVPKSETPISLLQRLAELRHYAAFPIHRLRDLGDRSFVLVESPCEHQSWKDYERRRIGFTKRCLFLKALMDFLQFLGEMELCLLDLNPDQVYLRDGKHLRILGLERALPVGEPLPEHVRLDSRFAPPEVRPGEKPHPKSTVYQLGVWFHWLALGELPTVENSEGATRAPSSNDMDACRDMSARLRAAWPAARPDWSAVQAWFREWMRVGEPEGSSLASWRGCRDRKSRQALSAALGRATEKPTCLILRCFPGREFMPRLNAVMEEAEKLDWLALHHWVPRQVTTPFQACEALMTMARRSLSLAAPKENVALDKSAGPAPPSGLRSVLIDRLRPMIGELSAKRGLLLILEDLHFADENSLRLLAMLPELLPATPICLVFTTDHFAHRHLRRFRTKWRGDWSEHHAEPDSSEAFQRACLGNGKDGALPCRSPGTLKSLAGHSELLALAFTLARGSGRLGLEALFHRSWPHLRPKEQLVLEIVAMSAVPMCASTLSFVSSMPRLTGILDGLIRSKLLRPVGAPRRMSMGNPLTDEPYFVLDVPFLGPFCRSRLSEAERRHILERLDQWVSAAPDSDPVQRVYLQLMRGHRKNAQTSLRHLRHHILDQWDLDLARELTEVGDRFGLESLASFEEWCDLLWSRPPKRLPSRSYAAVYGLAKALRCYSRGRVHQAGQWLERIVRGRAAQRGIRAHALVLRAEWAAELGEWGPAFEARSKLARFTPGLRTELVEPWRMRVNTALLRACIASPDRRLPSFTIESWSSGIAGAAWWRAHRHLHRGDEKRALEVLTSPGGEVATSGDPLWRARWTALEAVLEGRMWNLARAKVLYQDAISAYESAGFAIEAGRLELVRAMFLLRVGALDAVAGIVASGRFDDFKSDARRPDPYRRRFAVRARWCLWSHRWESFRKNSERARKWCRQQGTLHDELEVLHDQLLAAPFAQRQRVSRDLKACTDLLSEVQVERVSVQELRFALDWAHYFAGTDSLPSLVRTPDDSLDPVLDWRVRFLAFLRNPTPDGWAPLVAQLKRSEFSVPHGFLVRTAIEKECLPGYCLDRDLLAFFHQLERRHPLHLGSFITRHFPVSVTAPRLPGHAWEHYFLLLEGLQTRTNPPRAFTWNRLADAVNSFFPFRAWGFCTRHRNDWQVIDGVGSTEREVRSCAWTSIRSLLNDSIRGDGDPAPRVLSLPEPGNSWSNEPRILLLLIERINPEPILMWFFCDESQSGGAPDWQIARLCQLLASWMTHLLEPSELQRLAPAPLVTGPAWPRPASDHGLVGHSETMVSVRHAIDRLAPSNLSVFVGGESGSGKELVARAVHRASARSKAPFRAVNCSQYAESLIESELFGHVRGAFTGAVADRVGLLEALDGGTLFLDEIADIGPRLQSLLLRVFQEGEFFRLGEHRPRRVDLRFITATNRNLEEMVAAGSFREDLYYRLMGARIILPPLRKRREDIPDLVAFFATRHRGAASTRFSDGFVQRLQRYDWPGNVRELETYIARALVLHREKDLVTVEDMETLPEATSCDSESDDRLGLREIERRNRHQLVRARLHRFEGSRSKTAESLGISRQHLANIINAMERAED
ncbi:Sigma 54-interacting transcriptional regulator [Sulfidibacter corallicola]|uniref:Sigma 54-interacting transcriptional regulator n=1 Tax=Sulfidibacter corallicola TaxID=2818388 RepID=A0A8A4TZG3_SULCO|nr:sigma 54-interacting transcriptional regulator [Sulfidibacter corallicola]QTD54322.1 sigma 54-interacting transcriptional regulator [Sulfidibacter corallicola]